LENTIFENVHIEFQRALFLAYCFVKKMTYEETIIQTSVIKICNVVTSTATVTDWFTYCREICMEALYREYEEKGKIGGPGKIVEIDESKVSAFKCNCSQ